MVAHVSLILPCHRHQHVESETRNSFHLIGFECETNDDPIAFDRQIKNPNNATYFTNRALCNIKLKKYDAACQDCRRALDMDPNLIKGHFFLGLSLMEISSYDEAIKHLQRGKQPETPQKRNER